jgi:hypothetical protein
MERAPDREVRIGVCASLNPARFEVLMAGESKTIARWTRRSYRAVACAAFLVVSACGENAFDPVPVNAGETTLVVMVNPVINDANGVTMPLPGFARSNIAISIPSGPSAATDQSGVALLRAVAPGPTLLTLSGGGSSGQLSVAVQERDLREIAVSLNNGAREMVSVLYAFGGQMVEVSPSMSAADVNAELAKSNLMVFFRSGTYVGDLTFAGSNVTLFGEGPAGGQVLLDGNITVTGSRNRMRGVRVTRNLSVSASDFGMSFSRVDGAFQLSGSGAVLLSNVFCGATTFTGSGARLLGNAGLSPIPRSAGNC